MATAPKQETSESDWVRLGQPLGPGILDKAVRQMVDNGVAPPYILRLADGSEWEISLVKAGEGKKRVNG